MGYSVGTKDLKVIPLLKSLVAEFMGTMLLVIFGCGTAMQEAGSDGYVTKVGFPDYYIIINNIYNINIRFPWLLDWP